jgi:hypothetical protein
MNRFVSFAAVLLVVGCRADIEPGGDGAEHTVVVRDAASSALAPLIGQDVRVHFRRDAQGAATNAPLGRAVTATGTVRSVAGGWLVIERDRNTQWIPHSSILVIDVMSAPTTAPASP